MQAGISTIVREEFSSWRLRFAEKYLNICGADFAFQFAQQSNLAHTKKFRIQRASGSHFESLRLRTIAGIVARQVCRFPRSLGMV